MSKDSGATIVKLGHPIAFITMKKRTLLLLVGLGLMTAGLFLSAPQFLQARQSAAVPKVSAGAFASKTVQPTVAQATTPPTPVARVEGKPVHIQIPSLGINLPVVDGQYNAETQQWTLTKSKVHYAVRTPLANNTGGNTFLYGHNRKEVLRSLPHIKRGAEAIVETQNGYQFIYIFEGALETTPADDSLFGYQGPPILTVQTCSGVWNQNRQLFTFSLKEVR